MNNLAIAIFAGLIAISGPAIAADDAPKYKTVCHDVKGKDGNTVKDAKGKIKQECKKIRIHKKHEGKKVPDKKSKK